MGGESSKVSRFFRRGEQSGVESRELVSNPKAEQGTYDALRDFAVPRSEPRSIPGGGRSHAWDTGQEETTTSVETRSHPGSDSPVGEEADKESGAEQKEVTGSVKSERRPDVPPIVVVEDYETKVVSEAREWQQVGAASNRGFEGETTSHDKEGTRRLRSKSLNDMRSQLEREEGRLEEEKSKFEEVLRNSRVFMIERYESSKKLSELLSDREVSERLGEQIGVEKLRKKSVESLREEILKEPGGQEFIDQHDYSRGLTPQSRAPKKTPTELFEERKREAVEFRTKGAEEPEASRSGNESVKEELKFDKLTENLPGRLSVNERGEGGLSRSLKQELERESQELKEFPGLKNFRSARRSRSVSAGASPREFTRPKVQPEPPREQKKDDNDQPWPSIEEPVW